MEIAWNLQVGLCIYKSSEKLVVKIKTRQKDSLFPEIKQKKKKKSSVCDYAKQEYSLFHELLCILISSSKTQGKN